MPSARRANYNHIFTLIAPLNAVTHDEATEMQSGEYEAGIRKLIRQLVVSYFSGWTVESQQACKNSLQYYLSKPDTSFDPIMEEQQELCFPLPDDARILFVWVWEELFPGEGYQVVNLTTWTECRDLSRDRLIRRGSKR